MRVVGVHVLRRLYAHGSVEVGTEAIAEVIRWVEVIDGEEKEENEKKKAYDEAMRKEKEKFFDTPKLRK